MRLLASHSVTKLTVLSALSACAVAMPRFVAPPHDRSCVTKCKILCNFPYRIRHNQHIYSNRERCRADNGETQTIYWSGRAECISYTKYTVTFNSLGGSERNLRPSLKTDARNRVNGKSVFSIRNHSVPPLDGTDLPVLYILNKHINIACHANTTTKKHVVLKPLKYRCLSELLRAHKECDFRALELSWWTRIEVVATNNTNIINATDTTHVCTVKVCDLYALCLMLRTYSHKVAN